jgi:hypothetical protein
VHPLLFVSIYNFMIPQSLKKAQCTFFNSLKNVNSVRSLSIQDIVSTLAFPWYLVDEVYPG